MTKTFNITDGTPISLIDAAGFNLLKEGAWRPATPQSHNKLDEKVTETIKIKLNGTSTDDMALQEQAMRTLLRKAFNYHNTPWQNTPVYLTYKGTNESNPRYALVYDGKLMDAISIFDTVAEKQNEFKDMTLEIEREAGWRDAIPGAPGTAITQTAVDITPASLLRMHIANHQDTSTIDYIWDYDDGAAAFSANRVASSSFDYFDQEGDVSAVDDIVYFGGDAPFHSIVMNHGGESDASVTVDWEYWDGDSWEELADGTEALQWPQATLFNNVDITGETQRVIAFGEISDWAANEINSQVAYYIRAIVTARAGTETSYVSQTGQKVGASTKNYIEFLSTAIVGDMPPFTLFAHAHPQGTNITATATLGTISKIIMGMQSRTGLNEHFANIIFDTTTMDALLPATTWTRVMGANTTAVTTDSDAPAGTRLNVAFANDTFETRVSMRGTGAVMMTAYEGTYRVFIRCQQIGGSVGDTSIRLTTEIEGVLSKGGAKITSDTIALTSTDDGIEVVDMGIINIPFGERTGNSSGNTIDFDIFASNSSGANALRLYDIVFIPIDEWSGALNSPINATDEIGFNLHAASQLNFDSGVKFPGVQRAESSSSTTTVDVLAQGFYGDWELHGTFPLFEETRRYRMYYLMLQYDGAFGTGPFMSPLGKHLINEVYAHVRYANLRGAD